MIIPVGEDSKRRTVPIFNFLLIAANIAVFTMQATRTPGEGQDLGLIAELGLVPALWDVQHVLTSMYLHGSVWHLAGNLLFLFLAGASVEDRIGHLPYLVFYHVAGAAAAAAHIMTVSGAGASIPCVGASGAIAGVMGAYLIFFPTTPITYLVFPFMKTFKSPSWFGIGLWALAQWGLWEEMKRGKTTNIAVAAHLGGFFFGIGASLLLRLLGDEKGEKK